MLILPLVIIVSLVATGTLPVTNIVTTVYLKHRRQITLYRSVDRWADIGGGVGGGSGSGSSPSSGARTGIGAVTGSGAGANMSVGAGSVNGDEAESVKAGSARAGRVGDISSAGGSIVGEAGKGSSITGGTSGYVPADGVVEAQSDNSDRGGSIDRLDMGERRSSPSSSGPRSNSALFRRLLALFAGGVFTSSGKGGSGAVGDGGAVFGRGTSLQAGAATSDEGGGGLSLAAVAARPHHLRRQRQRW